MIRLIVGFTYLALALAAGGAFAAPAQEKKPTLYVDKIELGTGEVDVTYSYVSSFPPDPDDVLQELSVAVSRLQPPKVLMAIQ